MDQLLNDVSAGVSGQTVLKQETQSGLDYRVWKTKTQSQQHGAIYKYEGQSQEKGIVFQKGNSVL